jgi:hypothetical protein
MAAILLGLRPRAIESRAANPLGQTRRDALADQSVTLEDPLREALRLMFEFRDRLTIDHRRRPSGGIE